jgi:CDP-diacylglycerol--glycerol-3-phosphate 3-phosphatidyltransferase
MSLNIPNTLTVSRIILIPVLVLVFYWPFENHKLVAAAIFGLAAITDWFDGYLARKLAQMTEFGAFLDPVADKLMVAVALVLLVEQHDTIIFTLAACVIIGREIVISGPAGAVSELGNLDAGAGLCRALRGGNPDAVVHGGLPESCLESNPGAAGEARAGTG